MKLGRDKFHRQTVGTDNFCSIAMYCRGQLDTEKFGRWVRHRSAMLNPFWATGTFVGLLLALCWPHIELILGNLQVCWAI